MCCERVSRLAVCLSLACLMCATATDAVAKPPPEPTTQPSDDGEQDLFGPRGRGRGHRPEGWRRGRETYESLSDEDRTGLWQFMGEYFPELAEELDDLEQTYPEAFRRKMRRVLPHMLELKGLQDEDPDMFALRVDELRVSRQIRSVARLLCRVPTADRDPDKMKELRELVATRFDLRQKLHRLELRRLERRLVDARKRLEQARQDKAKKVDVELQEILSGGGDRPYKGDKCGPERDGPPGGPRPE